MSCNHCNTKFNFFHKEVGCSNCGLSFCSKCLKQKCQIPSKGTGEYNVCRTCYSKLSSDASSAEQPTTFAPPDTFLKRLENLENPAAPPIIVYKHNPKMVQLRTGLSPADQELVDRLEKLKEPKGSVPSEGELRQRLAHLKGLNEYTEEPTNKNYLPPVDTRSDQQKTDDMLQQFVSETEIELAHDPRREIEERLALLREKGVRPNEGPYVANLHDSAENSEEEVDMITRKIMDEVALEDKCGGATSKPSSETAERSSKKQLRTPCASTEMDTAQDDEEDVTEEDFEMKSPDELPWCVICNKDAEFRCLDCGGDLYCRQCNVDGHKEWGESDHRAVPYSKKSQK